MALQGTLVYIPVGHHENETMGAAEGYSGPVISRTGGLGPLLYSWPY